MSTQSTTSGHVLEESNIRLQSPCGFDPKYMADLSNMFNSDAINKDDLNNLGTQSSPETHPKIQSSEQTISPKLFLTSQEEPAILGDGSLPCESMSPDSYSIISSPQTLGWPSSSESGDSEHWTLRPELLPGQMLQTDNSPTSSANSWDCSVPFQFHNGPTSAGFPHDYSIPFSATTPSPMHPNYSPVFEEVSAYGSPQCPTSHYDETASLHKRALSFGMSDMGALNTVVCPTQPTKLLSSPSLHRAPRSGGDLPDNGFLESTPDLGPHRPDELDKKPYSQLLYLAFMSSPTKRMQLKAIYEWFNQNTNKSQSKGWQNSIRHNLSMNMAFKKAELREDGTESKRSTEWVLQDWAVRRGVESTTRYRKSTSLRGRKLSSLSGNRGRLNELSQAACRGGLGLMGCGSRARDRLYSQRMASSMQAVTRDSHLLYDSGLTTAATTTTTTTTTTTAAATATMTATPPPPPPRSVLDVGGLPDMGDFMGPTETEGGGMMDSSPIHGMGDYREFLPEYLSLSPEGYPMYPGQGNLNMGDPLMGGGGAVSESGLAGVVYGRSDNMGGVLASSPSMGMNIPMQMAMSMGLPYENHFGSSGTEHMADSQAYHAYTPVEYSAIRQGISSEGDVMCDWTTN